MRTPHNSRETPSRELLHRLYVEEKLPLKAVAEQLDASVTSIYRWLAELGIPARSVAEARKVAKKPTYTPEGLRAKQEAAARMREAITPAVHAAHSERMKGREPGNKGKPWTPSQREKLIAIHADPEYRRKHSERQLGELSPNWRGGQKAEHNRRLDRAEWRRTRKLVYARDNWTCQDCGRKCKNSADSKNDGRAKIQAHHILARRDGGTDELDNLTTLCMSCHHRREAEKKPRTPTGRPRFAARA